MLLCVSAFLICMTNKRVVELTGNITGARSNVQYILIIYSRILKFDSD